MKKSYHICDISGCNNTVKDDSKHVDKSIQVIFHTEQTEGRSSSPYLSSENLDICEDHMDKVLEGNYIHASGAQGNNRYYFKNNNTKKS